MTRNVMPLVKIIKFLAHISIFILVLSLFMKFRLNIIIFPVLPQAIPFGITCHYLYNVIVYQFVYYYIITYYLKSKLLLINIELKSFAIKKSRNSYKNFIKIIRELNSLFIEITEYNCNYWSKFLFIIWFTISLIISAFNHLTFLNENNIIRIIFSVFFEIIYILILVFIICISNSIYTESTNTYKYLNSIFKQLIHRKMLFSKFKVSNK